MSLSLDGISILILSESVLRVFFTGSSIGSAVVLLAGLF